MEHRSQPAAIPAPPQKPVLDYPFAGPPAPGHSLELAPGVFWIRMPLPYALDHINVWALDDGEGWAIVDTGAYTEQSVAAWGQWLATSGQSRAVSRVLVTHMHPDHVGMAGWLTRQYSAPLWMSRLEYLQCRVVVADCQQEAPPDALDFYHRAGWSAAALQAYRTRFGYFAKHIHTLPDSYHRLRDGQQLRIGQHDWRVVVGSGHSPEHACLYCPDLGLLISGDQVLPRISSNVSVHPMEPQADPMREWLASLAKLKREVPDDVLVLPAHGECFRGLHARLDFLAAEQHVALERLMATLATAQRVVDVFPALFSRPVSESTPSLLGMATGEALACLNHLQQAGRIACRMDDDGVAWYQAVDAA